jgi:hypothetical protein
VLRLRNPSRRLVLTDPSYFMWMYDRQVSELPTLRPRGSHRLKR